MDVDQLGMQMFESVKHTVARHWHPRRPSQDRLEQLDDPSLHRQDPVHVPAECLRQRKQPEGFGSRRAVDDHDIPLATAGLISHFEQRQDFLSSWQDRQLFGGDPVDANGVENSQ